MISDGTIQKLMAEQRIVIDPEPEPKAYQPASIDFKLDNEFGIMDTHLLSYIDPSEGTQGYTRTVKADEFYLHPGEFVLASTYEWVEVPKDVIAQVNGKSSLGRMGLLVHATAGFVDPGFKGRITLELSNVANLPIKLTYRMYICQLVFMFLDKSCLRPYGSSGLGSKYQEQQRVTAALGQ
jgi:dCTP deaminase